MLKLILSYLAGALTVTVAVYAAGGRATLAAFAVGFLIALVVLGAFLSSGRRIKRAARFLLSFAEAIDRTDRPHRPRIVKARRAPAPDPSKVSPIQTEVCSALQNFGMNRKEAAAFAAAALEAAPNARFEDAFKVAVGLSRKAA
jgi:hypothetical protein